MYLFIYLCLHSDHILEAIGGVVWISMPKKREPPL
jgi:hypothetical protein